MLKPLLVFCFLISSCASTPDLTPKLKTLKELGHKKAKINVSAASAIVYHNADAYVIADDERYLYSFDIAAGEAHKWPLTEKEYPSDGGARSKIKADYEAMMRLVLDEQEYLLVIPSGSKQNRSLGHLVNLNSKKIQAVDFGPLYDDLKTSIPELNIEGAIEWKDFIILFQRGNGKTTQNAMVYLTKAAVIAELRGALPPGTAPKAAPKSVSFKKTLTLKSVVRVQNMDLGKVQNTPLTFSDARYVPGHGIYFLASAEAHSTPQSNGQILGTQLGFINDGTNKIQKLGWFPGEKFEGLDVINDPDDGLVFYLVNDPDDRTKVSRLVQFTL